MSAKTYQMNKELLKSLIFQLTVPTVFMTIPFTVFLAFILLEIEGVAFLIQADYISGTLHSTMNTVMMIYFIKPYREKLIKNFYSNKSILLSKISIK